MLSAKESHFPNKSLFTEIQVKKLREVIKYQYSAIKVIYHKDNGKW